MISCAAVSLWRNDSRQRAKTSFELHAGTMTLREQVFNVLQIIWKMNSHIQLLYSE
jgi:hypothetical protein